jgi:hypothetical protein
MMRGMNKVSLKILLVILLLTGIVFVDSGIALSAVFTVDRTDDNAAATACLDGTPNDCSLRGAVIASNGGGNPDDEIILPPGIYTLSIPNAIPGTDEDFAQTGDLDLDP